MRRSILVTLVAIGLASALVLAAGPTQSPTAQPAAKASTAGQQYSRLVIRSALLINGRGTPTEGPVDIVIDKDAIADIIPTDAVSMKNYGPNWKRPEGDRVIDATGMYVVPGLVDMHAHIPGDGGRTGSGGFEYGFKLWLGNGVTTLRDPGADSGIQKLVEYRRLSEENKVTAPRLVLYKRWPNVSRQGDRGHTPDEARALVQKYKSMGADGIKVSKGPGQFPDVIAAICDEAKKQSMNGVAVDLKVSETDAVVASDAGVTSIEHWYGIPDAAIPGTQHFPPDYNYWNELDRFRWAGHLWREAEDRYPQNIVNVLDLMIKNGTVWVPTMVVYEANRDIERVKRLAWHDKYSLPGLLQYWSPNPANHGSYYSEWKTSDEIAWNDDLKIWMKYMKMFFEKGGTLTVGSDAGSIYALYGFSTIRELELMQEAGIHPIDIIKIATWNATQALGLKNLCGVRIGCTADLAVVDGNPLDNLKVLYGTGLETYTPDGKVVRRGGVKWTIKNGIVFDAQALLREVEAYVRQAKAQKTSEP